MQSSFRQPAQLYPVLKRCSLAATPPILHFEFPCEQYVYNQLQSITRTNFRSINEIVLIGIQRVELSLRPGELAS